MAPCHACHTHIHLLIYLHSHSSCFQILGCGDLGMWSMTSKFELWRNFCTTQLAAKFHRPMFNRSLVIVLTNRLTNKQTLLKTST